MAVSQRWVIAPQSGRGFRVRRGQQVRIVDPAGQQIADMWAFCLQPELDWISTAQTRDINERLFPVVGESFYSVKSEPLLTLVEDHSPGPHDMLFAACDRRLYERVGLMDHPNCRENFLAAARAEMMTLPVVPDPVNFFQNSPPQADGRLQVLASRNPAGGYVVLRAEVDLVMVVTACSVDFHPTNGGVCTAIEVELV